MKSLLKTTSVIVLLALASTQVQARERENRFNADQVEQKLEARGYDVDRVEEWGQDVRAWYWVDGKLQMGLFDPSTLQPL